MWWGPTQEGEISDSTSWVSDEIIKRRVPHIPTNEHEWLTQLNRPCTAPIPKPVASPSPHRGGAPITCQCWELRGESDRLPTLKGLQSGKECSLCGMREVVDSPTDSEKTTIQRRQTDWYFPGRLGARRRPARWREQLGQAPDDVMAWCVQGAVASLEWLEMV